MSPPRSRYRPWVRLLAALLLVAFGAGWLTSFPPFGFVLVGVGLTLASLHLTQILRHRKNRYDLNELQRVHEQIRYRDEHEEDDRYERNLYERNLAYCHHCGTSTASCNSVCPSCGIPLGS